MHINELIQHVELVCGQKINTSLLLIDRLCPLLPMTILAAHRQHAKLKVTVSFEQFSPF